MNEKSGVRSEFFRGFRFRLYLMIHALVVLAVMGLFHWIPEKQVAALFAGSLFILVPLAVIHMEWNILKDYRSLSGWGCLLFLLISALPVFLLRVMNWGTPFDELSLLGVSGPDMHKMSNGIFLLMLLGFVVDSVRIKRRLPKSE